MIKKIIEIFLFLLIQTDLLAQKMYVPAFPDTIKEKLPDGSDIKIFIRGDESNSHIETEDGYTIQKNMTGYYEYIFMNKQNKPALSGMRAKNIKKRTPKENKFLKTIPKKIRIKNVSHTSSDSYNDSTSVIQYSASNTPSLRFPPTGNRKALALLIRFKDLDSTYSKQSFDSLFNTPAYRNTGSFKDFFLQNSFQKLNVTVDVYGWYTADSSYKYYVTGNRPSDLVVEAIKFAKRSGVDFSTYDNDKNSFVDGIIVIHSGPGQESTANRNYIWSHSASGFFSLTYDEVTINNYSIQPEILFSQKTSIGVFCHEFGHLLGLPDLYDTDESSQGLGNWCLMGTGNWLNRGKTPSSFSAYCKKRLGWANPILFNAESSYILKPSVDSNVFIRINTSSKNEYFLMENRQKKGFDSFLPGSGLAIYHIDTDKTNNSDDTHRLVDLEEADTTNNLDYPSSIMKSNRGDTGDLFPGTYNRMRFNDNSQPNSKTYDTKNTNISISQISESSQNIQFYYSVPDTIRSNITSITPKGWSSTLVISKKKGYNTDDKNFSSDDSLYVDINFINNGYIPTAKTFINRLALNNQLLRADTIKYSLSINQSIQYLDIPIGKYNPDSYQLQLTLDALDSVYEIYENDNIFTKEITITPPNDEPCNATELTIQKTYNPTMSSNVNASASQNISNNFLPGCFANSYNGGDVWFRFVIPPSGTIDIITKEIQYIDGLIALYSGTCSNLTFIECVDDYDSGTFYSIMPRIYIQNKIPGSTFYIRFFSYHNNVSTPFYIYATNTKSTVTIHTIPESQGKITGNGTYNDGDTVILHAYTPEGYTFDAWTENDSILSSDTLFSFSIKKDRNIIAKFIPKKYPIKINVNIPNAGEITGNGTYSYNETASIQAHPLEGYTFDAWTENDSILSRDTLFSFSVKKERNIIAKFIPKKYILTISLNIPTAGKIIGNGTYDYNQTATLSATLYPGYIFVMWKDNDSILSLDTLFSFSIKKNKNIGAVFSLKSFTISLLSNDQNAGIISGAGTYQYNQLATIRANPSKQYRFIKWTENEQELSKNNEYQFYTFQNHTIKACFETIIPHPLTNVTPNETFTLFPNPNQGILTILLENNYIGEIIISIYSLTGIILKTEIITKKKQKNTHTIAIQNLPKGKYIIELHTKENNITQELIKD